MYVNLLIGMIVASVYCYFIFPKNEGGEINFLNTSFGPIKNGKLYLNGYRIHHWLFYSIIAIVILLYMIIFKKKLYFLLGFCFVMIFNGLQYNDAFSLL
jgi:hypothetical protein